MSSARTEPASIIAFSPIPCPCCGHAVHSPTLDMVIEHYAVRPMEARILKAIWRGHGHIVPTRRILDAMYEDDPSGGPADSTMYRSFKVGLFRLRQRLNGSGVSIEGIRRQGYRLLLPKPRRSAFRT